MEPYEREFYISRICAGYIKYKINPELSIYVHPLTIDQQYEANEVFRDAYNEALLSEVITGEECMEMLKDIDLWSDKEEESLERLGKDIEELKVQLYNAAFRNELKNTIRKALSKAKNKFLELASKRATYDFLTCKGYAVFCRYNWTLENATKYPDDSTYDWEHVDLNSVLSFYHKEQLDDEQLRELAKTEPWRSIWSSSKKNGAIFNRCGVELTEEQRSLIAWSSMYDNVYESMECPPDNVIEDDDVLDGWLIIQKRKREEEQKKSSADNVIGNSKINNADEVFIMTDPQSAKDVDSLNDPVTQATKKARVKDIKRREKAGKKFTKHAKLRDVKQRVQMEANQKYSKSMKGR